jgi:hypothetical protein
MNNTTVVSVSLNDYFHHARDEEGKYAHLVSNPIRSNAEALLPKVNKFLALAAAAGVYAQIDGLTGSLCGSGWRPLAVNAATSNAALHSPHLSGRGIDLRDDPRSRALARWAVSGEGRKALEECGLWCERPGWTPSWLHCQDEPPHSGSRFFIPSIKPAMAPFLPGEE